MARILVVDDRPTNRQLLLAVLGYAGHQLVEAADGAEALQRVHEQAPDLIITDILMPIMSGFEFVQHLRADNTLRATPVIFYTASYSEPQALKLAEACEVRIVLPKPCEPERVLMAVNEALNLHLSVQLPAASKQRVAFAARDAMLVENLLSSHLRDLNSVRRGFIEIIERHAGLPVDQDALSYLSGNYSKAIAGLSLMAARLSTLVQAGFDLLQERDAEQVARHCFDAACNIIGSTNAAIVLFDDDPTKIRFVFTKGIDSALFGTPGARLPEWLRALSLEHHAIRLRPVQSGDALPGFPSQHPAVSSYLGVPIATTDQTYGWLYFVNRLGAAEFSDDDERIAVTLALQAALLQENFSLYDMLQNHAVQLQLEVAERLNAERELTRVNESLEARVAERTAELQVANAELEAFSYSVSHDLRGPLTAIAGFTQLLMNEQRTSGPGNEQRTFLHHIETAVLRTMAIIDALMRLSQLSRQALDRRPVNVMTLVIESVEMMRQQDRGRSIDVQIQELPDCVGDAGMLQQLFANLLSNAFKFTRHKPNARITIGCIRHPGEDAYFVADNGVGFNPDHAARLFAAFQRDHTAAQFEGAGVGLSIVQRIVTRHGGRIWAETKPGEGASFYFTLG
jgi:signal transduction histidine kinase/DNA-binding response OmpR family regulator